MIKKKKITRGKIKVKDIQQTRDYNAQYHPMLPLVYQEKEVFLTFQKTIYILYFCYFHEILFVDLKDCYLWAKF